MSFGEKQQLKISPSALIFGNKPNLISFIIVLLNNVLFNLHFSRFTPVKSASVKSDPLKQPSLTLAPHILILLKSKLAKETFAPTNIVIALAANNTIFSLILSS